jgi:apolipoprotein N-acyltransferase
VVALAMTSIAAIWAGGAIRLANADSADLADIRLRIVQGNIAQAEKWRADKRRDNLARYIEFSSRPGGERVSHFIWPETAVPYYLETDEGPRSWLARLAQSGPGDRLVITGAVRRTAPGAAEFRAWNTIQAVDGRGEIVAGSDKLHLVPFGEFLPARALLARIGLDKLAHGSVDFTAGAGNGMIEIPGLPPARALICYEAIFPEEIIPAGSNRPGWLLNVTNDAWFGNQAGPYQHFAMARTRAVEQGLPLVRAANTGISAIVDPYGRVRAALGLGTAGVLDGGLPRSLPPTMYAQFGDAGAVLLWFVFLSCLLLLLHIARIVKQ